MNPIHTLQTDLAWLRQHPQLSMDDVVQLMGRKKGYKTLPEYGAFKEELNRVRMQKLPFRIELLANEGWKKGQMVIDGLSVPAPDERKEAKRQLRAALLKDAKQNERLLQTLEKVCCLHGTNSAVLALAPQILLSTGGLLDDGKGPMSGEINRGGTKITGVNQTKISCVTVADLPRCIEYATQISHSFTPPQNPEAEFCDLLEDLECITPDSDRWDQILIGFYHIKQWDPETFMKLTQKYADRIARAGCGSMKEQKVLDALAFDLKKIEEDPDALKPFEKELNSGWPQWNGDDDYDNSLEYFLFRPGSLKRDFDDRQWNDIIYHIFRFKACGDKQIDNLFNQKMAALEQKIFKKKMGDSRDVEVLLNKIVKPIAEDRLRRAKARYARRFERKRKLFEDPPKVRLTPQDREYLQHPFPLLVASTLAKPTPHPYGKEYNISSLRWGDEIDMVFVFEKDRDAMNDWIKRHGLIGRVQVLSLEALSSLNTQHFCHAPDQVRTRQYAYQEQDLYKLNEALKNHVFPLYRANYPDGSKRFWHGVPHAMRTVFFAQILVEMALEKGLQLQHDKIAHLLAMALHDAARLKDGTDLWDAESGQLAEKLLREKFGLSPEEAAFFGKCIAEKDARNSTSLEQQILHDGDCLEILRCLRSPSDFKVEELRLHSLLNPMETFVEEVKQFILLTDLDPIKTLLETSEDPYTALIQILVHANENYQLFPTLRYYILNTDSGQAKPYQLTPEIEADIKSSSQH